MSQTNFMSWRGNCVVCGKIRKGGHGLFRSNFLLGQATFPPCRNVWCGGCYREASNDRFPRLDNTGEAANTSDLEIETSTTSGRYRSGRDGNHLMGLPFECNLCSFRNFCGRQPVFKDKRDQFTLTCIQRVQLDVMWAREPHTVASNWAHIKADYQMVANNLSVLPHALLPPLGCKEIKDRVGMAAALATLLMSLRPGRNATNIQ
jgi:hypothetical protein